MTKLLQLEYKKGIHYPSLDGLRGIAVILVFTFHTMSYVQIFRLGWIGVDLFFVLSGFLITGILYDSKNEIGYYKNFIVKRALRIFPLYFIFILLIIWVLPTLFPTIFTGMTYYQEHQAWYWFYISNWLPMSTAEKTSTMLDHLWSLSIEEQFYVCWPFFVVFLRGNILIKICLILICCAIMVRYTGSPLLGNLKVFQYTSTLARIDSLLIGSLISILYRLKPVILIKTAWPVLILSSFLILLIISREQTFDYARLIDTYTLWDLFFGAILTFSISQKNNLLKRILNFKFLKFFGKYSYGLYIYHLPIIIIIVNSFVGLRKLSYPFLHFAAAVLCIVTTIGIALLSYYVIEKPFLKLKKYFEPIRQQGTN